MNGEQQDENENLSKLPGLLEKVATDGDAVINGIESSKGQLTKFINKFKNHIVAQSFLILLSTFVLIFFYFFERSLFIETVFSLFVVFLVNLVIVLYTNALSFQITNDSDSWTSFKNSLLYSLRHLNGYIDLQISQREHRLYLEQFRDKSQYVMVKFGLIGYPGIERAINSFNSASESEDMWIEELSEALDSLGVPKPVFKLMFFEPAFAENERIFHEVKSDVMAYGYLRNVLVGNSLIKVDPTNIMEIEAFDYVLRTATGFKLEKLRIDTGRILTELNTSLNTAKAVITIYFPYSVVHELPFICSASDFENLDNYFINAIAKTYSCDNDVISFLFYPLKPSATGIKVIQELRAEHDFLEKLIRFLLKQGIIISGSNPSDLVQIVNDMLFFSPEALQTRISNYEDTLFLSREFRKFIVDIGAEARNNKIGAEEVFEICNSIQNKLDRALNIAVLVIREFELKISQYFSRKENMESALSKALLLLFLFRIQSPMLREACIVASSDVDTVGMLYDYAIISDVERSSLESTGELILKTVKSYSRENSVKDRYFMPFREALSRGVLYKSITELDRFEMDKIYEEVNNIDKKISDISKLDVFKKSLRDLLENALVGEKIESLLEYGTVNAFIMTKDTKSRGNVWEMVEKVAKKNKLVLGAISGGNTRFGLVPRNVSFESFSKSFETLYYKEASKPENQSILGSTTLNLFRFVPSRGYTKVVGASKYSISEEIGDLLMGEGISQDEKISLLASLEGHADTRRSVGQIISSAVNKINVIDFITELARNELRELNAFPDMSNSEKMEFETEIRRQYSVQDLKNLSVLIYRNAEKEDDRAFNRFRDIVYRAMHRKNRREETENTVRYLYEKMKDLGMILSSI